MKSLAVLVSFLCAAAASAPEIDGLIDAARGAPAEFAADALIRIGGLDRVEKPRKIELLQQAFDRAGAAQEPFKLYAAITRFGGAAAFLNRVHSQDLDAMSLRLRAIEGLLPLDGRRARDLFLQIPSMRLPPVTCSQYLVPDVSRFYEVLGRIAASQAFTAKEMQEHEPRRLVERFAGAVTAPTQIGPAARMIAASGLSDDDLQSAVTLFAGALQKVSGDDRSFTHSATSGRQIEALAEECKRRKISALALLEAYRTYLIVHLSGARCADDDLMMSAGGSFGLFNAQTADMKAADAVSFFNERLLTPPLHPIEEQEATPSKLEGKATGLQACEDAACQAIARKFHSLIFNPAGLAYQAKEKETGEWRNQLQDFMKAMADWNQSPDSSAEAHFRDKCGLYNDLIAAVPTSDREMALRGLLDYARRNPLQAEHRIEWFLPVNGLIGRAGLDPLGLRQLMEQLRRSDDPIISLFANLEALAPRTPDRILPLL